MRSLEEPLFELGELHLIPDSFFFHKFGRHVCWYFIAVYHARLLRRIFKARAIVRFRNQFVCGQKTVGSHLKSRFDISLQRPTNAAQNHSETLCTSIQPFHRYLRRTPTVKATEQEGVQEGIVGPWELHDIANMDETPLQFCFNNKGATYAERGVHDKRQCIGNWPYSLMASLASNPCWSLRAQDNDFQTETERGIMLQESWSSSKRTRGAMRK